MTGNKTRQHFECWIQNNTTAKVKLFVFIFYFFLVFWARTHPKTNCVYFSFQVNEKYSIYFPSRFRLCSHKLIRERFSEVQYDCSSIQRCQFKSMSNMNKQKVATTQSYQSLCGFYRVSLSQGFSGTIMQTSAGLLSTWMWVWDYVCLSEPYSWINCSWENRPSICWALSCWTENLNCLIKLFLPFLPVWPET